MAKKENDYTFDKIRVVMVSPTEPGNIGAAARALKTMNLSRLVLVNPAGYPSAKASARASGADDILARAKVYDNLEKALTGAHLIVGVSARKRGGKWRQSDILEGCREIQKTARSGLEVAVLFGTEKSGLSNRDLDLCQLLMKIPGNPDYHSLNVAAAVQVFAYQNFILAMIENSANIEQKFSPDFFPEKMPDFPNFEEMENLYEHIFQALEYLEYFDKKRPKELLQRRIRHFFKRTKIEKDEVAILHGILRQIKKFEKSKK